ncbi:LytR family transcriptional regulator [Pseudactinotalea sp. HY160]|uniref:LCP family protein n=1 Tax=Pseudactinotalea sp. HY160 TaxID=2654490 RepID=UPI00128BF652|nr:LCP family protein [Pseudactinotalea sp. HY160]MPV51481.1 LytR family transcriptional regulator [Pseudactinotalea sp. HY160]
MTARHGLRTGRRARRTALLCALAVALAVTTASATVYNDISGRINTLDTSALVPTRTPDPAAPSPTASPVPTGSLTLLLIGSDGRGGANGQAIGDHSVDSVLADTNIVVHLSQDRDRVDMVSIPRDTMLQIPDCTTSSGQVVPGRFGQFNSAFAFAYQAGGDMTSAVACDITTVQSITGLELDGFVLVEMAGFVDVVDALGGVDITIPNDMSSREANLDLEAGPQHLDGTQALAFARARKGIGLGDGSDLGRIERQQYLLTTVFEDLRSRNLLTDGRRLYQVAAETLEALTLSPNLGSIPALVGLARSMEHVSSADITSITAPVAAYAPDPDRVQLTAAAAEVWAAIAADRPLPADIEPNDYGQDPAQP